jgi:hypothetical protein
MKCEIWGGREKWVLAAGGAEIPWLGDFGTGVDGMACAWRWDGWDLGGRDNGLQFMSFIHLNLLNIVNFGNYYSAIFIWTWAGHWSLLAL